jgi:hypothetical protein
MASMASRLCFERDCPELAAILRSSAVRTEVELCLRQDAAAVEQQRWLMREATTANVCLMLAGVLSGLVLVGAPGRTAIGGTIGGGGVITDNIVVALGVATLALGALAAMFSHIARDQDRLGRWLARRGVAELARLDTFRAIAREVGARPTGCPRLGTRSPDLPSAQEQTKDSPGSRGARHSSSVPAIRRCRSAESSERLYALARIGEIVRGLRPTRGSASMMSWSTPGTSSGSSPKRPPGLLALSSQSPTQPPPSPSPFLFRDHARLASWFRL